MTKSLHYIAYVVGLAAVCWVGAGYVGTNPLALMVTLLIGAFYLMGGWELHRYDRATTTLARAVADAASRRRSWARGSRPCSRRCATRCACASKANASACPARR